MAEPSFAPPTDDDLPRTLRRAKQEREEQERLTAPAPPPAAPEPYAADDAYAPFDDEVTVTRLEIPFFHLMGFFIKAVFAAIPALIILGGLLWGGGYLLKQFMPWLVQAEILIRIPN